MKHFKYFLLAFSVVFFFSCKERIDFELNTAEFKKMVVEGLITDQEQRHLVKLSFTSSYYEEQEAEVVSGAEVTISDGIETWVLTESPVGTGYYYTEDNVAGTVGATHTLTINYEGKTYEGTEFMYPVAELENIEIEKSEEVIDGEVVVQYNILIWTQEPVGVGDFYRWRVYENGVTSNDSLEHYQWLDDNVNDGLYLDGIEFWSLDSDLEIGDTITMDQMSISKQANDIFIAMNLETIWRGGLFDSAPSNIETNITNGAIGYFGASSVSSKTTYIEE